MKLTKTKILCLLLAGLMLFSLTACGKDKNPDLIKLGEYELHYKGACIMEDSDGNDAIVLKLDFTNNSKESASYPWSVSGDGHAKRRGTGGLLRSIPITTPMRQPPTTSLRPLSRVQRLRFKLPLYSTTRPTRLR